MSLRLIRPGMSAAALVHPKTGEDIEPLYIRADGSVVWPALGASPDDPNDPKFTGEDDEDDEEDDEDEDDKPKNKKKSSVKEDDDEDDEDDESKVTPKSSRQAMRYRRELRVEQAKNRELNDRLKALEDKDKKPDEIVSRDLTEARNKVDKLTIQNREMVTELAFLKSNTVAWVDPSDALALAQREGLLDDVVDEDGTVDVKALRAGLKDLAKRKPHLVQKPKAAPSDEDDEDDDDDEPRSRRSAPRLNGRRKGDKDETSRAVLAKKFPVLRQ